jgi:hypothetical protein
MCKVSTFSGTCAAVACDGDAVQCAIAKEQYSRNCKLFEDVNAFTILGNKMMSGTDAVLNPAAAAQRETSAVSGLLNRGRLLSSSCPPDLTFTIGGQSVSMHLANLCTPMQWFGVIAVALTLLSGMRITLGA